MTLKEALQTAESCQTDMITYLDKIKKDIEDIEKIFPTLPTGGLRMYLDDGESRYISFSERRLMYTDSDISRPVRETKVHIRIECAKRFEDFVKSATAIFKIHHMESVYDNGVSDES